MTDRVFHVDAFTSRAFSGNPAAVALLDAPRDDAWLQSFAAEMNLSETAYPRRRADGDWDLRWFTPTTEVDLCGHATLASAHALWTSGIVAEGTPLRFHTRSGELVVGRASDGRVELDFPALRDQMEHVPDEVAAALGLHVGDVHHAGAHPAKYRLVVVHEAAIVRAIAPDFPRLRAAGDNTYVVTAEADTSDHDVVSRYFAPVYGIDEDPATGAAHCVLTPYWTARLGRNVLRCRQESARGAELECEIRGDRVLLRGDAVTISDATLTI